MVDLLDPVETNDPVQSRLRLSIRFHHIESDDIYDLRADLYVGLFAGETPLFAPTLYHPPEALFASPEHGYFYTADEGCYLLQAIHKALCEGGFQVFEDCDPDIRIIIAEDLGRPDFQSDKPPQFYDVLTIIQHGGTWNGQAMGSTGPALNLSVGRADLEGFFFDLLDEAMKANISDDLSRERLLALFPDVDRAGRKFLEIAGITP